MNFSKFIVTLIVAVLIISVTGCISQEQYDIAMSQNRTQAERIVNLDSQLNDAIIKLKASEKRLEELENMGFSVRDFGATTWVLSAVPALAGSSSPQDLFLDILERFGSEGGTAGSGRLEGVLATMACKAAIKSGDVLSDSEIKALLQRMVKADLFSHCPHGRPVVKVFNPVEIKKWFHRT